MTEQMGRLMLVSVGSRRFAVPLSDVAEVTTLQQLHPVPGAPSEVSGAINRNGRIVPVISLAAFWGMAPFPAADPRLVVFHPRCAAMALLVDGVGDIVGWDAVLEEDAAMDRGVARQLMFADGEVGLVTCQGILEEVEEMFLQGVGGPESFGSGKGGE